MLTTIGSRRRRRQDLRQKLILYGMIGLIGLVIVGFLMSFILFAWLGHNLPSPGKLSQTSNYSTIFYDRDGKVIYEMYKDKNRVPVESKDIAQNLKNATVAIEDKTFYKHKGISETGIIRAFISIIFHQGFQGGSTITQQLIKNTLLTSQQTLTRKIKEWMLASEVERRYTKDQILTMYLNENPYGGSFYGVGTAAEGYFGKTPKDLTLIESAILAGLPQSPSYYSPYIGKKDAWKGRTKDVLRRMREDGYITSAQEQSALKQIDTVRFKDNSEAAINAPHFIFYLKQKLEEQYGPTFLDQGLKIKTTLSLDVQQTIQDIVKDQIGKLKDYHVGNGAAVVLDSQTGEILGMVGSYDFNDENFGKFNAALGQRQPGSTLKPITYATAFEKGYTPATVLMDVKTQFGHEKDPKDNYNPVNYDGKFRGPVQVRFALGNSLNIPAVKMLAMVGLKDFMTRADQMGLHSLAPTDDNIKRFGLSVTLGGGETTLLDLTSAYTTFARGGSKREVSAIKEITDYHGKTIYKQPETQETKIFSPEVSYLISHILSDNNARIDTFGPRSYLNVPGKTVAVKTGTTDDKRDNWTVGFTKSITVGVWVGNNDNSPMNQKIASGITGASPIWYNIMYQLLKDKKYPDGIIDKPDNVVAVNIDALFGGLPKDNNPTRTEFFVKGTEPTDVSPYYKKLKISKSNGKIANDIEVRTGNYDEKDFYVVNENDPTSIDGTNLWQQAIDDWAKSQGDDKWHYPTETSDNSSDSVVVNTKTPQDRTTLNTNHVEIKAHITSESPIKNVKIYINGNELRSIDGDNKDIDESFDLSDGVYNLKITAWNDKNKSADSGTLFGVNKPWDSATPTPSPTPKP